MAHFKITDKVHNKVRYVEHYNGSQLLYCEIEEIVGMLPNPCNDIPYALEVDGWGDDQACIGDTYEADEFEVECIAEKEFNENN